VSARRSLRCGRGYAARDRPANRADRARPGTGLGLFAIQSIFGKLQVSTRGAAALFAIENGLV
jgi:hypothetical protein